MASYARPKLNAEIQCLMNRAKAGDLTVSEKLEHWKTVMRFDIAAVTAIDLALKFGQVSVLDEQLTYALAEANGGRGVLTLNLSKVASAFLDFCERPFYKDKNVHWIRGGEFRAKDDEKAKVTILTIMKDGTDKFAIKLTSTTRENLDGELAVAGLISCKRDAARDWARWILDGSPRKP